MCMHVCMYLHMCVYGYIHSLWRPRVDVRVDNHSTSFVEPGSLSQTQSLPVELVLLASLLWGLPVSTF